jgi:RNA 2',3'-cyclic 3'-phosphodiesterase
MKPHRIFIAINLPEDVKNRLLAYKDTWPEVPAKWTTKENLHLTLAFLGNTSDQELAEVCRLMQEVGLPAGASAEAGEKHKPFALNVNRIVYGPNLNQPRMIWALVEKSPDLLMLQKDVTQALERGHENEKSFSPHLTLARLNNFQLRQMEWEEIPEIDEEISLSFEVNSIEIMESELKRSGAQYTICQSIPLQP